MATYTAEFQHLGTGGWFGHVSATSMEHAQTAVAEELRRRGADAAVAQQVAEFAAGGTPVDCPEVGLAVHITAS